MRKSISGLNGSRNQLLEFTELGFRRQLEEIDISHNQIDAVDWCETLSHLKWLDLSFNQISDVTALLDLRLLEYVNLVGNPVSPAQIKSLQNNQVLVISG
jgi:Leucine-rich repeat (LRR) protein